MTTFFPEPFDAVVMWNGSGVGSDADQQSLLCRIAEEWLTPSGVALLDIFNPYSWSREAGVEAIDDETGVRQRIDFDPIGSRFVDTWWFDGD